MGKIRETFRGEDATESHATMDCEQVCLSIADDCEGVPENNEEVCRDDFVACVSDCETFLSPVS
jgi:hypothetical protein